MFSNTAVAPPTLAALLRAASWEARIEPCSAAEIARMEASSATIDKLLAEDVPIYGLTQSFGPLVVFDAESEMEQGSSLISHLGTGQGEMLSPEVCRLVFFLRLSSMRKGFSAVAPHFWQVLADLWNKGFTPAMHRDGTVSASGDLQPLAQAALAVGGTGVVWARDSAGEWELRPATGVLRELGAEPVDWPVREALAFVNGTGVSLAVSIMNQQRALRVVRASAMLTARIATLLGANPEHFRSAIGHARGQSGQVEAARWIEEGLPLGLNRNVDRPLQEPYSLRCAPQVLGAVLDQLTAAGTFLAREVRGCTDNPIVHEGELLHGGNFHAMPVGFASDQIGLAVQMAAYLVERQLGLVLNPTTNGGLPPMLTPRAGRGCALAGVQISATSFVARIRQLVYPASLTTLPTNGWNQDHVPMALNGANGVADALDLAELVVGSLALAAAQLAWTLDAEVEPDSLWSEIAAISPALEADRPMAAEVRAARDSLLREAGALLESEEQQRPHAVEADWSFA